jgi:glycosyltransferase involved in cell wall biosynthesis
VNDRIVFTGFVPEEQKADYYRLADAYVMPSQGEGFGIAFLEALACGIPVLGSRVDGSQEALLDGALGCLADPSKPAEIERGVLEALRRGRGAVPQEISHYSYHAFANRAEAIVREALANQ